MVCPEVSRGGDRLKRRTAVLALALVMILAVSHGTVRAEGEAATVVAHGSCGDDMTWILDSEDHMSVQGKGAVEDYALPNQVPWRTYRASIVTAEAVSGVTRIGNYAFAECDALESMSLARSVREIGNYAFSNCAALTDPGFARGLVSIGNSAFSGCVSLTALDLPVSVTSIGQFAFRGCTGLTEVDLPSGVERLMPHTFQDCTGLTRIGLPAKLKSIGVRAFKGCTSLRSISISQTVDTVADYAFEECDALEAIYYAGSQKEWKQITTEDHRSWLERWGVRVYYDGKTEEDPEDPHAFAASILHIGVSGAGVSVDVGGGPDQYVLIAAAYDPDGRMIDARACAELVDAAQAYFVDLDVRGAQTIAAYLLDGEGHPASDPIRSNAVG